MSKILMGFFFNIVFGGGDQGSHVGTHVPNKFPDAMPPPHKCRIGATSASHRCHVM